MSQAREAVVVGIGRTEFSRNSGRTTLDMAQSAARAALDDAGLKTSDVDGLATFQVGDSSNPSDVGHSLGLDDGIKFNLNIAGGGDEASFVVNEAIRAVQNGECDVCVVYRSLNSRSGKRLGRLDGVAYVGGPQQFGAPHGYVVPPQWFAMQARRHMHEYGTTREDLGAAAINNRRHAEKNPHAIMRKPLTMEEYLAARPITEPFHLYDCALEADGAVALVITTAERARDLKQKPIKMLGHELSRNGSNLMADSSQDFTRMYSAQVGPRLWESTGLKPSDMDFACLYDCFTYTLLCTTEDFGFCQKGEGGAFYRSGRGTYGGEVVINPHGGLLSEAYIHGLNHHYEAVMQLRGQAGERQVKDAKLALVSAGGLVSGSALVFAA